ncbi:MAG TPA: DUF2520 domain-containing protein [Terriglobales bacterium]|nr:DUF2520 domain-containing protein [Terriglobales bacterium]
MSCSFCHGAKCYAAAMAVKPRIAIVGPGRLGSALALELTRARYRISEIVSGESRASRRKARALASRVQADWNATGPRLDADVIWFCVPDREIARAARRLADAVEWTAKTALHSSGALGSDELRRLRARGAAVASVHPVMTFVAGSVPSLQGVPFALEGDLSALRLARRIVRDLGGEAFSISKNRKMAYHAWGAFASPLLIALLVTAERVARAAGLSNNEARRKMLPIVRQTLANYAKLGPAGAFSGPIVRGDAPVVRQHLKELKKVPEARAVYLALARAGLRFLPSRNRGELEKALGKSSVLR